MPWPRSEWCGQAKGAKKMLGRKGKPEESDLHSFSCLLLMRREMEDWEIERRKDSETEEREERKELET